MSGNEVTNVIAGFEILLEQIEIEIDLLGQLGGSSFSKRDFDQATVIAERCKSVANFRERVATLRREWDAIEVSRPRTTEEDTEVEAERRNLGRLQRGIRTPEESYYSPILDALVQLGGSGKVSDVLDRVETTMTRILSPVDLEPLASNKDMPRWRNAAQWARLTLVQKGLMESDSPRGIWEITSVGRQVPAGTAHGREGVQSH